MQNSKGYTTTGLAITCSVKWTLSLFITNFNSDVETYPFPSYALN